MILKLIIVSKPQSIVILYYLKCRIYPSATQLEKLYFTAVDLQRPSVIIIEWLTQSSWKGAHAIVRRAITREKNPGGRPTRMERFGFTV
jgi:hypothetical protein